VSTQPVRLLGKVAVVTGAARGIGFAIARAMTAEGARVFLADLPASAGAEAAAALTQGVFVPGDVTDPDFAPRLCDRVLETAGRLDLLVNNAGVLLSKPFEEVSRDEWRRLLSVNLEAVYFTSQQVARVMRGSGGGAIVNIASTSAFVSSSGQSVYEISKAGVHMLTRSLALELAPWAIRVNAVAPGLIDTEMTRTLFCDPERLEARVKEKVPLGRAGRPEDVAQAVVFLASDEASYLVGETILVDGGWMLP
jgi:NAD(P)-dependent dehydrogenase (short-subunit alcohol dehydrogenase family)